ncbi:MAG: TraR/DksA C4-type zinc finger protein [Pirellulaceae bacterium]
MARRSASAKLGQASSTAKSKPSRKKSAEKIAANKSTAKKPTTKKPTTKKPTTKKPTTKAKVASARPTNKTTSRKSVANNGNGHRSHPVSDTTSSSRPLKKASTSSGGDYDKFRQLLLTVRQRLQGDVSMMSQEALGGSDGAADNHAPIHPAEVGTHSFEQEFTLNLLSSDGDRLERIDAALEKIGEGTYGACDECGGRIPRARLEVIPDTPFCVKCATRLEV